MGTLILPTELKCAMMWFATFSGETVEKASERVGMSLGKMILQDVNYHHYGTLVLIILVMGRKLFFQSWLDWSFTGDQNLMKKNRMGNWKCCLIIIERRCNYVLAQVLKHLINILHIIYLLYQITWVSFYKPEIKPTKLAFAQKKVIGNVFYNLGGQKLK